MTAAADATRVRPGQLSTILRSCLGAGEPVLVTGSPGSGKSGLVEAAAREIGADLLVTHPVVSDPTDFKGLPWPDADAGAAHFLPFGDLHAMLTADSRLVVFLDDLGQAPQAVQAAVMQLLLARRVNDHVLPDCVSFVAATNRRTDRAGVTGILEPVKSRFSTIVELEVNLDDWCQWAIAADVQPEVIAFIRFRPDLLQAFDPTAEMVNTPTPRTWASASRLLRMGFAPEVEAAVLAGAVGAGAATEFRAYLGMYRALPNIDAVFLNPRTAPIPDDPAALYAVTTAIAHKCDKKTFDQVLVYATRLHENGSGEFAALLIRDSQQRCPEMSDSQAFQRFGAGPLAEILHGVGG